MARRSQVLSWALLHLLWAIEDPNGPGWEKSEWEVGPCTMQVAEPCDNGKILYYLFHGNHSEKPQLLHVSNPKPTEGTFDPVLPTHVIIHGYVGHVEFNTTASLRKAFLAQGGSNVLVVDWGKLATNPCYPAAVFNTLQVGHCVGQLLAGLADEYPGLAMEKVHAIGFSLGAHVAAFASNSVEEITGSRLGRITGLDPALPLFATLKRAFKLDSRDADFVDAIHTNVGVFGKVGAVGHADFYMNGGTVQPACEGHKNVPLCSHLLAPIYFAESISSVTGFWGVPCQSYYQYVLGHCPASGRHRAVMGEHCDPSTRGVFFVETASSPPYALG